MWAAREVQLRARDYLQFQRREPGLVGGLVSNVVNPLLGGPTTTQRQPTQTTTPGGTKPDTTTAPSPAGNTPSPVHNGGGPTASPNSGTSGGGNNDDTSGGGVVVAAVAGSGSSLAGSPTGSASGPSGSGTSGNRSGTSGISPGGTATSASDGTISGNPSKGPGNGSGSSSATNSNTGGGPSDPSKGGSSYSSSGSGISGNGDPSPPSDVNTLSDGKGNSSRTGAIAAAVILTVLFGIAVVIFILRRRSRTRRNDQANKWWFTCNRTSQTYGDNEALRSGNSSRRSSFATTVDHSNASFLMNTAVPPPPPMAEVGRSNGTAPNLVLDVNADQNRFSIGSAGSHGSQFLIVHHRESLLLEALTSARTESFPFPKPPIADRASLHSKASHRSRSESKQDVSTITPPSSPSLNPMPTKPLLADDPFADNNPFEDPVSAPSSDRGQNLTEIVRRPFFPQLQDELQVSIGDSVRILQSFDDGWALAEKVGGTNSGQGFLPLECFNDTDESSTAGKVRDSFDGADTV